MSVHDLRVLRRLLAASALVLVGLAVVPTSMASNTSGEGTMAVAPAQVSAGATGLMLHLTFTATTNGPAGGGQVTVQVPAGWPAPQTAAGVGHVSVSPTTCRQASVGSITGSSIVVDMTCRTDQSFEVVYGPVTAPSTPGPHLFTTASADHKGPFQPIAAQPSVMVSAAAATHFVVSAPSSSTAGVPFTFTVRALDQFNNLASGYTGTVHFSSTDGLAVLPTDVTLSGGSGTLSATLKTAGAQTITATDTATPTLTGTSNQVTVGAAAASQFALTAPASATSGVAFDFTVTALDQFGNTATGYSGTAHFTTTAASAVLPADSTLTNGTATFSATLQSGGSHTITATDTATPTLTGTTNTITVT
jgi:hypothetical protein